jgi:hypothetical protein
VSWKRLLLEDDGGLRVPEADDAYALELEEALLEGNEA